MRRKRSEEHTSELQSQSNLVCRPPPSPLFPYTTLFRSITGAGVGTLIKLDLRWESFQFQSRAPFYWIILAFVAISLVIVKRLEQSRFGAYLVAVRENEDAAKEIGRAHV